MKAFIGRLILSLVATGLLDSEAGGEDGGGMEVWETEGGNGGWKASGCRGLGMTGGGSEG